MTPQEKMQKIIEAAGECWHEVERLDFSTGKTVLRCRHCKTQDNNPSPTDLNELFQLAEKKYSMVTVRFEYHRGCSVECFLTVNSRPHYGHNGQGKSVSESLLDALYQSIKEVI